MKRQTLTVTIFLLAIIPSFGQQFYSRNYDINSGLPNNCIRDIYKDSRGFLWLGTDAGLARFDGRNFIIYNSQDGLAGNKIWSIAEGAGGNIWVGCHDGGVSVFNGHEIKSFTTENGLISNEVRKIHFSKKYNLLLIGTEDGLSVYENKHFISFHKKFGNVNKKLQVTYFLESDGFIYIFTKDGELYKYTPLTKSIQRVPTNNPLNKQNSNSAFISSHGDTLINLNRNSLLTIKNNTQKVEHNIGEILDYAEDFSKNIWIAAWGNSYINSGGLFKYNHNGLLNFNQPIGIKSNDILSLEFDSKENLLWIGTKDNGLFLYPLTNFSYYKAKDFNLPELNIKSLKTDNKENLWICTREYVIKKLPNDSFKIYPLQLFNKEFEQFANSKMNLKYNYLKDPEGSYTKYEQSISLGKYPFPNPYKKLNGAKYPPKHFYKPLKYNILIHKKLTELNTILEDSSGNIWVGSNVGVFKMDEQQGQITYFDIEGTQFKKFYFDEHNRLYSLSWPELYIYPNIEESDAYYYYDYYKDKSPINVTSIRQHNGNIWFASSDHGLFVFDGKNFFSSMEQKKIANPSFNDLCVDTFGNTIAAGNNGVIYIVELLNDTIQPKLTINIKNKKLGTTVRFLNCDENNQLIVGTNAGLNIIPLGNLYDKGTLEIYNIDESKGFIDYSGKISINQNGKYLWVGSNENLIKANLSDLRNEPSVYYNFFIKSILVNDEQLDFNEISNNPWTNIPKKNIELPYYKNSITINFDVIKYIGPENIEFSYKLDGYHKNWIDGGKERKAVFRNLNPGKYRFRIKVVSKGTEASNQELSINFTISPPFWYKWWVILLAVILLFTLIRFFVVLRTRTIKKREHLRAEIAERITEFELKALRAQMNPHFIFNAINSIQNYMLDNNIDAALSYLSDFAKLIRLTLDNVSKKQITLDDELNYLKYYISLEQMRFDKKFELEIVIPPEVENNKILIPSMILQPYIENSIKHGFVFKESGGKIKLEFKITENNILKCIIEDNGIGRQKSRELNKNKQKHKPKGTFITNERLSLLNQTQQKKGYKVETIDLYDEFGLACGTRVEISIPI